MLQQKRAEYWNMVPNYFEDTSVRRTEYEEGIFKQIHIDIPRTNPDLPLFQVPAVQDLLERILYIWSIRHPASGYVQGINDLVTPFITVFLASCYPEDEVRFLTEEEGLNLDPQQLREVEADSYWCFSKLIDSIQDHYTFAQPGIQRMVQKLEELVERLDAELWKAIRGQGLEFLQFAFRWMNCLLMRELPMHLVIRVWDTYLAEGDGFAVLHVYVCAAYLLHWKDKLLDMDFADMIMFIQHPPTDQWSFDDVEILLSQAFVWKTLFEDAQSHLKHLKDPSTGRQ